CISSKQSFLGRTCLTWSDVRELDAAGIRFGSHSVNHPVLQSLPVPELKSELSISKASIEDALGHGITSFAYPYAFPQEDRSFTQTLANLLGESGYWTCVTTIVGLVRPGDDLLRLNRLPVNSCDDCELFLAKVRGCYDWVGPVQRVARHLKLRRL